MIAIIDYGAGNLKSISNAFKKIGADTAVVSDAAGLGRADAIVLPGVGNFGDATERLTGLRGTLLDEISSGKPFLGLCLGLQLLFEGSDEAPGAKGLGVMKGRCVRFPTSSGKTPHMGWNSIKIERKTPILNSISDGDFFYFVHSYYTEPIDGNIVVASCRYGVSFPAVVEKKNVFACQFHPERSGEKGLKILENFVKQIRR